MWRVLCEERMQHPNRMHPAAGFELTGAVGEDPVRHLSAAFERQGSPVQVRVLLNDTVGVLAAGRYADPSTMVGVILGTGATSQDVSQGSGNRGFRDSWCHPWYRCTPSEGSDMIWRKPALSH